MKQSEVAQEILNYMAKFKIKHPEFDNVIVSLQKIKDDKVYRNNEEAELYRKQYINSSKVDALKNKV